MVVGNGLIGSLFKKYDKEDVVFFASGVSNSLETEYSQFKREEDLITKTLSENKNALFIYFSTCSIYDSSKTESAYVLHKLKMEQIIANSAEKYLILRVSNAVGNGGNENLLLNYLFRNVSLGKTIDVYTKATRNLIDVEDIKDITYFLIENKVHNKIINVAYLHEYPILEILEKIETLSGSTPKTNLIEDGNQYHIHLDYSKIYFEQRNLINKSEYLGNIITRYYLK